MAFKLPKLPKVSTALGGSVAGVKAPSGVGKAPTAPMIDRKQNVGVSNLTKTRWGSNPKLGNHR